MKPVVCGYYFDKDYTVSNSDIVERRSSVSVWFQIASDNGTEQAEYTCAIIACNAFTIPAEYKVWISGYGYYFVKELTPKTIEKVIHGIINEITSLDRNTWAEILHQISIHLVPGNTPITCGA